MEGFVRQLLGWREFIRGVYWLYMPHYARRMTWARQADVPAFFWDGDDGHAVCSDNPCSMSSDTATPTTFIA